MASLTEREGERVRYAYLPNGMVQLAVGWRTAEITRRQWYNCRDLSDAITTYVR